MATNSKKTPNGKIPLIAENKKAFYNYFFEERYEAGMVLEGWEVKSIREGEMFIIGVLINALRTASTHINPETGRTRKLLLNKEEIKRLTAKIEQKGYTLVPLNLHWKNGRVK